MVGALIALAMPSAYAFSNGQDASLVLGQTGFTGNTSANGAARMNSPRGVAVDPNTGRVFVADASNNRVLRFASLEALANGASAEAVLGQTNFTNTGSASGQNRMNSPRDVFVDSAGRLWVADTGNNRVLRFNNAATLNNGANASGVLGQSGYGFGNTGTAQNRMNGPEGVFVDSAGRLWVADTGNNRVLRFNNAATLSNGTNASGVLGQSGYGFGNTGTGTAQDRMNAPRGVAVDSAGRLWVADTGNNRVLRFNNAATLSNGANASGVLGQSGYGFGNTTAGTALNRMNAPRDVAVDSDGRLWVADTGNNRVLRFDNAATLNNGANASAVLGQANYTTGAANRGGATAANTFSFPAGVAVVGAETLWVADQNNNRVLQHDLRLAQTITFAAPPARQYGDAPFTLSATASSGLAVSFSSSTPDVCTVSGDMVTIVAAGACTIAANQAGNSNYRPAPQVQQTFTVSPATLTVTANDQSRSYGAANPTLTYSVSGLVNGDSAAEVLTGAPATTATAESPVGSYPITQGSLALTPVGAANYSLSFVGGTLEVTPATLTVTADDQSRSYGAANPTLTYSVSGLVNGDSAAEVLTGVLATTATAESPVGSYPITQGDLALTPAGAANYSLSFVGGTLEVTPATLTVTANDAIRKIGQPNPVFTISYSGFVNGDDESVLTSVPTASTTADENSPAGSYEIVVSGGSATNYTLVYVSGTLTVTNLDIPAIAWDNPAPIVYGTALGGAQLNAAASFDDQPVAGTFTYDPPAGTVLGAGNGQVLSVTFVPDDQANFATVTKQVQIDVTPATLTVVAANKTRVYGGANPALTFTVSGLVNGDTQAAILEGVLATTATATSPVGSYPITQGSLALTPAGAANYTLSFSPATLSVTRAPLTVKADNATRRVGEPNPTFTATFSGFVNGEDESVLGGSLTFTTTATSASPAGTYDIVPGGLTSGNYAITYVKGTLTVLAVDQAPELRVYLPLVIR